MIPQLVPMLSGGFSLDAFMASQSAGFWIKGDDPATLFQGTDETTPVTAFGDVVGRANDQRVGAGSPISSTQPTTSFKPKYQPDGLAFDGTDDNLLTNYTAGSGANTLIAKVVVPVSLSADQIVVGAHNAASGRFFLGAANTGNIVGGIGATSVGVIRSTETYLGQTIVMGISQDGSTVRLFGPSGVAYEGAQSGSPTTAVPLRIGSSNVNGTASSFFGGSVQHALGWQGGGLLDLARFNQIANALGA